MEFLPLNVHLPRPSAVLVTLDRLFMYFSESNAKQMQVYSSSG